VLRIKGIKNIIWVTLVLPTLILASFIAYNHTTMDPQTLAEFAIPLLKWGSLACTIIYLAYIVMHIPLVRSIYQAKSVIYPRYNAVVAEEHHQHF